MPVPAGRQRISTPIAASVAAVILITVALMTTLDVIRQRTSFLRHVEETGILLSRTLNDVLGNAMYFNDVEQLRHLVDTVRANPEIRHVRVFAADGRILVGASGQKYPVGQVEPEVLRLSQARGETRLRLIDGHPEIVKGIEIGNEIVGGVQFVFATAELEAEIAGTIRQHLWQALLVLALGGGLSYYISRSLVRPIRSLTAVTRRIAAGDLDSTVEAQRQDEIGELAVAMQEMIDYLRRTGRE